MKKLIGPEKRMLVKYWFKRRFHLRMFIFLSYLIFFVTFIPIYWIFLPATKNISIESNITITIFLGSLMLGIIYELLRHSQSQTNWELENLEIICSNIDSNDELLDDKDFALSEGYFQNVNLKRKLEFDVSNENEITSADYLSSVGKIFKGTGDLLKVKMKNNSQFIVIISNKAIGTKILFPSSEGIWFAKSESKTKVTFQRKGARRITNYGI